MSINLGYSIREGFLGFGRARLAAFVSIVTIFLTLTLLAVFFVLSLHIHRFIGLFNQKMAIEVYFDNSMDQESVEKLGRNLESVPGVSGVQYISKEEALHRFRKEFGEDPETILGSNPLPASFQIGLEGGLPSHQNILSIVGRIERIESVDEVLYHGKLIRFVSDYGNKVLIILVPLVVFVVISTIFLIANTLRLIIYAQRENIEIMELVGATREFIHRPYLIQGVLQGSIGGLLSGAALWVVVILFSFQFPNLLSVPLWVYFLPVLLGLVLGWIGSLFGLRRFMKA